MDLTIVGNIGLISDIITSSVLPYSTNVTTHVGMLGTIPSITDS